MTRTAGVAGCSPDLFGTDWGLDPKDEEIEVTEDVEVEAMVVEDVEAETSAPLLTTSTRREDEVVDGEDSDDASRFTNLQNIDCKKL